MKSMLHEASTVIKAIQKAWEDAGKPLEFTVNIHEIGEKNFLGFTKRPAIISLSYDPKKLAAKAPMPKKEFGPARPKGFKPREEKKPEFRPRGQPLERGRGPQAPTLIKQRPSREEMRPQPMHEERWEQEWVHDISDWFKDVASLLGTDSPFSVNADRKMLTITFERNVLPTIEDERQLFSSLSYLAIQFLKKKHKKKLRGFHLVISSKRHADSASKPPASSF